MLGQIRQSVEELPTSDASRLPQEIQSRLSRILDVVARRLNTNPELQANIEAALEQVNRINTVAGASGTEPGPEYADVVRDAVGRMTTPLEALDRRLRELRRQASIGAPT